MLKTLCATHSTSGDEGAVADELTRCWRKSGWKVATHGAYAISARRSSPPSRKRPRLLICAHMDSPGFIVDRPGWTETGKPVKSRVHVSPIGTPCFSGRTAAGRLKCRNGIFDGTLRATGDIHCPEFLFETARDTAAATDLRIGDRVCFKDNFAAKDGMVESPFLDNRLGCWMLARLASLKPGWNNRYDITLGAAGSEEMTGYGAQILAAETKAALVIVLDATYEAEEQGVTLGGGAVVTLSDKAILLSPDTRDRIMRIMSKARTPIQFEAYNYSGTDARAFPMQGRSTPVIALLLPTRGNHSPCETADLNDLKHWENAIKALEKHF